MATQDLVTLVEPTTSFDDFYGRYRARMLGLAFVLTGRREDIDEIVHDAFVSILPKWIAGELLDPFAYLKQTVVNRCLYWRRRHHTDRGRLEALEERNPNDPALPTMPPFEDARGTRDVLWNAVAALPPDQRTAIALRYLDDLPVDEIAHVMSAGGRLVPAVTVRSWIHRGLAHLARVLDHDYASTDAAASARSGPSTAGAPGNTVAPRQTNAPVVTRCTADPAAN